MEIFLDIVTNYVLVASLCAWLIAQMLKLLIVLLIEKKLVWERLLGDGGMPSAHTATVSCLALMVGHTHGYGTPLFAVALLFAIVVAHDASGVRRETGKQALAILQLFSAFNEMINEKDQIERTEKLKVLVGHTPLQVFFGFVLGLVIAIACILIFNIPYLATVGHGLTLCIL